MARGTEKGQGIFMEAMGRLILVIFTRDRAKRFAHPKYPLRKTHSPLLLDKPLPLAFKFRSQLPISLNFPSYTDLSSVSNELTQNLP